MEVNAEDENAEEAGETREDTVTRKAVAADAVAGAGTAAWFED